MTTLVLLPGMDGSGLLFKPFVSALDGDIKPIVIDYPGAECLSYPELTTLVQDRLPSRERYFLLGESFSGPVAITVAANLPPNLAGLVLCGTFARNPRPALAALKPLTALMLGIQSSQAAAHLLFGIDATPLLRQQLQEALHQTHPGVLRARLRMILDINVTRALPAVTVPALCLRALRDRLVPAAAASLMAAHLPRARIVDIDSPHMLLQTRPVECAQAIMRFMRDTTS